MKIKPLLDDFLPFARKRIGFNRPPTIHFSSDSQNAYKLLGKTGYYDPKEEIIVIYVDNRHPKDVLRSLAHELVHHKQNCDGKFTNMGDTGEGYAQKNPHLRSLEKDAFLRGNMCFRDWEDGFKQKYKENYLTYVVSEVNMPASAPEAAEHGSNEGSGTYVIVPGDTLTGIAQKEYGNSEMWALIYKYNEEAIGPNADLIYPGGELIIPHASLWSDLVEDEDEYQRIIKKSPSVSNLYYGEEEFEEEEGEPAYFSGTFTFPLSGRYRITSPFGMRDLSHDKELVRRNPKRYGKPHMHGGVDFGVAIGTPVLAPFDGKITTVEKNNKGAGNYITFKTRKAGDHPVMFHTFMHLSPNGLPTRGEVFKQGEQIARTGNSGQYSSGAHLHWEVRRRTPMAKRFNPLTLYDSKITSLQEWKNKELNRLLLEKFNIGDKDK
jgi:murein DD-endopeptidase MepM/ murein hydrolase activator NlpD